MKIRICAELIAKETDLIGLWKQEEGSLNFAIGNVYKVDSRVVYQNVDGYRFIAKGCDWWVAADWCEELPDFPPQNEVECNCVKCKKHNDIIKNLREKLFQNDMLNRLKQIEHLVQEAEGEHGQPLFYDNNDNGIDVLSSVQNAIEYYRNRYLKE